MSTPLRVISPANLSSNFFDVGETTPNQIEAKFAYSIAKLKAAVSTPAVVFITDSGKEGIFCYDPTDTISSEDSLNVFVKADSKRYKRKSDVAFSRLPFVSSSSQLSSFIDGTLCQFDGSTWERKAGNVASNGGGFAGTIINVSTSLYWERKFTDSVNVEYFGIKPDGNDYSVQIQYVIDNFTDVVFNKGTYFGFFGIYRSGVKVKGQGSSLTILKCPNNKMHATDANYGNGQPNVIELGHCYMGNSEPVISNIKLSGITVDGNKANNTAPIYDVFGWGLACTSLQNSIFEDINAINCHAGGEGFFINSNFNTGDFKVSGCGFNLGTPGFDLNSSSYNIFSVISRDCKYGGRILDNCWGNNLAINIYNATSSGLICNNQSVNESHSNVINFNIRYGCADNGLIVGTKFNSNKFVGTITDINGAGVQVVGIENGISEENVPSSNNYNISTNNCGYQSVITQGRNDIWDISSYQDGRLTNQGDIFVIEIKGKKSQFTINLFDRTVWRVRGIAFRSTSINNKLISYIYQNTADPLNNAGSHNRLPIEFGQPVYADNASAITAGLISGENYRTSIGIQMVVF